jgi:ATP adenylyltransferase
VQVLLVNTMKQLWAPWRLSYLQGETPKLDECIFCAKQNSDDLDEQLLYRGQLSFVVLNRYPYNNGHLMIVPYQHTGFIEDLRADTLLEIMQLIQYSLRILREVFKPEGFNVGVNEGSAGGAGITEHIHFHIVPRWEGDSNYMTVIGGTRVIPQTLEDTYRILRPHFDNIKL